MEVSSSVDGDAGVGVLRYGVICAEEEKYCCAINCDATDYEPLRRDGADAGDVGRKNMVGTGYTVPGGREGGRSRTEATGTLDSVP